MTESYILVIKCEKPHQQYDRKIPYNWHPSNSEIFDAIRRLRGQAVSAGDGKLVMIKQVSLRKIEEIESNCVCLDRVNGRDPQPQIHLSIEQED